jgi:uncharacterized protein YaaQ
VGILERSPEQIEFERRHARALSARMALRHLERQQEEGLLSPVTWNQLQPLLKARLDGLTRAVQETLDHSPGLGTEELMATRREALLVQRNALEDLRRDGVISDETHAELASEIDAALDAGPEAWGGLPGETAAVMRYLLAAVVDAVDLESAVHSLAAQGARVTRMESRGGFLQRRNHVLWIAVADGRLESVVETLRRTCRRRVEYLAALPGPGPLPVAEPVPVDIGGATVFAFRLVDYVEL